MRSRDPLRTLLALPTVDVARGLIGWRLERSDELRCVGRIVETEAYLSEGDGASHSARGRTARNAAMYLAAGHAYVYLIYGLHHCLNVVTAPDGVGEAVLIRGLEPLEGLDEMRARRGPHVTDRDLCRGPGRLCQALGMDRALDGHDLRRAPLRLIPPECRAVDQPAGEVLIGPRVGISKATDLPLRFRAAGSQWTS